jgi:Xaa-Pro aminopeptidase
MKGNLESLRRLMKKFGLDAYLVPGTDPHQDEYIPEFWQRRKFISGFRGSSGDVVITQSKAGLWTDSRYFLQAEQELDKDIFQLFKMGKPDVPGIKEWLTEELGKGKVLGVDPQLLSHRDFEDLRSYLKNKDIRVKGVSKNLVDIVWKNRPNPSENKIRTYPLKYSGESTSKKLARVRKKMREQPADILVISALDEIAWLFNIRGKDIKFNPLAIAFALIFREKAMLFIERGKLTKRVFSSLKNTVAIYDYEKFFPMLGTLAEKSDRIWLDESRTNQRIVDILKKRTKIFSAPSPVSFLKSIKNKTEIEGFRRAHIRDGAAMVKFLFWLDRTWKRQRITERLAAAKLKEFRAGGANYQGPSFETISAFGSHSAIVHYGATSETDIALKNGNIYLIDSGAQYWDATTDITRTIFLGEPRRIHRECFTRVLQGLLSLTMLSFPQGTAGRHLDTVARLSLWKKGQNYGHGTGHGIGTYLNVHEGPHAISPQRCVGVALEPGMITTIEPGVYLENRFGIRLENVVLVEKDEKNSSPDSSFYRFETLTLCPIDRNLVKKDLLRQEELDWFNAYHRKVKKTVSPLVDRDEKDWLEKATRPI